jgi:hypothetical protein
VAATVAASTTSLTASPIIPTIECGFFFAISPTSHVPKYCVTSDPARSDGAQIHYSASGFRIVQSHPMISSLR